MRRMILRTVAIFGICLISGFKLDFVRAAEAGSSGTSESAKEKIYIQSVKAQIKEAPQLNAKAVILLERGAELTVLEKKDTWFKVTAGGKTGWISKLFVSTNKPVGAAALSAALAKDDNLSKAARRRSSSYSVSASTRGLLGGGRAREGREKYPSDPAAVDKMDRAAVPDKDLKKFQEDGKLEK